MNEEGKLRPSNSKIYFFERFDGMIIPADAREAWGLYKHPGTAIGIRKSPPKLIGVSDGSIYYAGVREAQKIQKEQGLSAAQEHVKKALELEIESARGKIEVPPNHDTVDRNGNAVDVSKLK